MTVALFGQQVLPPSTPPQLFFTCSRALVHALMVATESTNLRHAGSAPLSLLPVTPIDACVSFILLNLRRDAWEMAAQMDGLFWSSQAALERSA